MLTFILPVISAVICAGIEYFRIKAAHGKIDNVNKFWSVNIAFVFFGLCLALSVDYYDYILPHHVLFYALYFIGCRGLFYDVCLNLFRGLPFDYFSKTTNSLTDNLFRNLGGFWALRAVSLFTYLIFGYLWLLSTLNMI
jgi:hypothetical protein